MNRHLRSLLSGAGLRALVYAVAVLIGLFLTPYLVRTLGDRQYAIFVFAGLFTSWCGLVDFGMTTTSARFVTLAYSKGNERRLNETASSAAFLFSGMGLVVLAAAVSAACFCNRFVPADEGSVYAGALLFSGAAFAVSKLSDALSGVINGVMRQELTGWAALAYRLALGAVTFLIVWRGGRVVAITVGWLGVSVMNLLVLAVFVRRAYPSLRLSPRLIRKSRIRELFGYSVYAFVQQLGTLLVRRSDLVVIGALLTLTDVTHYNLAVVTLASYFVTLSEELTAWQTNWFTHLFQKNETKLFEESRLYAYKGMTYLTVFMAMILIFWARDFLAFWVGDAYLDAFGALVVIAGGLALYRGSADVNIRVLQGIARHQILAPMAVGQGIVGIVLAVVAAKSGYGMTGVAAATIVPALVVNGLAVPLYVCRLVGERPSRYFAQHARHLIAAAAAFLPAWLFLRAALTPALPRLALGLFGSTLLWLGMIWLFGLSRVERKKISAFFRKKGDSAE
ncbi:MAG: oligosaccharide flippase family protein [Thermoguttaceae bacterium]|nr:oligosaccharide flippase family protein [Thermoguttaceae bacterium]